MGEDSFIACEHPPYVLTLTVPCCERVVTSRPPGIACPPDCSEAFGPGARVRLELATGTATWEGCDASPNQGPACAVTMVRDREVGIPP